MEASLNSPLGRAELGQGTYKIGHAPDNTLVINDSQASSYHAEVGPGYNGKGYQVIDLNSTNGTFVNEQRLTSSVPHALNTGDVIRIGALNFTYDDGTPGSFHTHQTISNEPLGFQPPISPQPPVASNYSAPAPAMTPPPQPVFTPPPAPQPQVDYPHAGALSQPGSLSAGFGQPASQPRRRRVGLWIGLLMLLLILIGGIGAYLSFQNRSTPDKTLQALCTAFQNENAQDYYNILSSENQSQTDVQTITTDFQRLKSLTGGYTNCTYRNVITTDPKATAMMTLTPVRGNIISLRITLVDENGQWKIRFTLRTF